MLRHQLPRVGFRAVAHIARKRARSSFRHPPGAHDHAVSVRYVCPACGGDHPAGEHDLSDSNRQLDAAGLRRLARNVEHELAAAAIAGQPTGPFVTLLRAVEARLERLDGDGPPTLGRRQTIAAERSPTFYTGRAR
jgi:hypothetical protein